MNKREFEKLLAKRLETNETQISRILGEMQKLFIEIIYKGGQIKFGSIGTFYLKQRKERFVFNPHTQGVAYVPPKKVIAFKASKKLI